MGFYGSIYYQVANAFAKILITNSGKGSRSFADPGNILKDEIAMMADGRGGSFYLDAGNRWIQLEGNENTNFCTLWHAPPDSENAEDFFVPFQKVEEPSAAVQESATPLSGGSYFSTPVIYYDKAGHLVPTGYLNYFTIPKTDYENDLEILQDNVDTLLVTSEKHGVDIEGLKLVDESTQGNIETLQNKSDELYSFIGDINSFRDVVQKDDLSSGIQEIKHAGDTNTQSIELLYLEIGDLKKRIALLEAQ